MQKNRLSRIKAAELLPGDGYLNNGSWFIVKEVSYDCHIVTIFSLDNNNTVWINSYPCDYELTAVVR